MDCLLLPKTSWLNFWIDQTVTLCLCGPLTRVAPTSSATAPCRRPSAPSQEHFSFCTQCVQYKSVQYSTVPHSDNGRHKKYLRRRSYTNAIVLPWAYRTTVRGFANATPHRLTYLQPVNMVTCGHCTLPACLKYSKRLGRHHPNKST